MKKAKKKSIKKRLWENIFVISSIVIIIGIIGVYAYRTVYYYHKLNYIEPESTLKDVITNKNNITYTGDGLYKGEDNTYYYSGTNPNNYLLYSGLLWRIISVDDKGIKIITDDNITSLVWSNNTNYEKSLANEWLNTDKFINVFLSTNDIIISKWCDSAIDINDYKCEENYETKVGLITIPEYIKAGGVNSYLNNHTYFWTINYSSDKTYYIHSEGGINNDIGNGTNLYSYGIRPVIYISSNLIHKNGDGAKDNPYKVDNSESTNIKDYPIGTYVTYQNYTWRIIEKNDESLKLILDGYLTDDDKKEIKLTYSEAKKYLTDKFINTLNKDDLVKTDFTSTEFNNTNNYNYKSVKNKNSGYIGLPVVSDMFINEYSGVWLDTIGNNTENLIYTTAPEASLIADLTSSTNYLRPIISIKNNLNITTGSGIKKDPYVLGDVK